MAILFFETKGEVEWKNNSNWMSSMSVCDWYHVDMEGRDSCNDASKPNVITSLWLPENSLSTEDSGRLPIAISLLSNLKEMNMVGTFLNEWSQHRREWI